MWVGVQQAAVWFQVWMMSFHEQDARAALGMGPSHRRCARVSSLSCCLHRAPHPTLAAAVTLVHP